MGRKVADCRDMRDMVRASLKDEVPAAVA